MKRLCVLVAVGLCLIAAETAALAQTASTITGTATDASGGALPGVSLTLQNAATGLLRTATTAADGRFVFAEIPAGTYNLRAELSGFRPVVRRDLPVTIAQALTVPVVMDIGGVEQAVTVEGGATAVNTQTSELSFLVGEQAIASLPLNGRNYTDLALLQPGVLAYPSRDGGSVVAHGLGMSVNGQDYRSNVYLLDGTLQNDFTNGPAGSAAGTALGMESIREFRVESNAYSAEFGRNYGGQINVLTKSGTNTLRGSAYEFHRNDALDARNYFDVAGKPDFTRNQFGGDARRPAPAATGCSTSSATKALRETPGQDDHQLRARTTTRARGVLPDGPVTISAAVRPYLDAIPRANGPSIGGGLATHTLRLRPDARPELLPGPRSTTRPAPRTSSSRATRYDDARAAAADRLPAVSRARSSRPTSSSPPSTATCSRTRTLQTARFGYSRTRIGQNVEANLASPLPPFVAGRELVGDIDIGGMQRFGPQSSANLRLAQNVYSGQYDVTHTRGRHLLKAGALAEHYRDFMTNPTFSLGIYTFANVRAFLENRADAVRRPAARGRHRPRLAVDALRRLRAGQLPADAARSRSTPGCATRRRRCRSTPAAATRRSST